MREIFNCVHRPSRFDQRQDWYQRMQMDSTGLGLVSTGLQSREPGRQLLLSHSLQSWLTTIWLRSFPTHLPALCLDASATLGFFPLGSKRDGCLFNTPRRASTLDHKFMYLSRLAKVYYYTRTGVGKLWTIHQIWSTTCFCT